MNEMNETSETGETYCGATLRATAAYITPFADYRECFVPTRRGLVRPIFAMSAVKRLNESG